MLGRESKRTSKAGWRERHHQISGSWYMSKVEDMAELVNRGISGFGISCCRIARVCIIDRTYKNRATLARNCLFRFGRIEIVIKHQSGKVGITVEVPSKENPDSGCGRLRVAQF